MDRDDEFNRVHDMEDFYEGGDDYKKNKIK
jgi:hypothetical protein